MRLNNHEKLILIEHMLSKNKIYGEYFIEQYRKEWSLSKTIGCNYALHFGNNTEDNTILYTKDYLKKFGLMTDKNNYESNSFDDWRLNYGN